MKLLSILFTCICFSFFSCKMQKERMIDSIAGEYSIDMAKSDSIFINKNHLGQVKLVLEKTGKYFFIPSKSFLREYEGKWDLSNDIEHSYFVFFLNNGGVQENRTLFIKTDSATLAFKPAN